MESLAIILVHIFEPGLNELALEAIRSGNLQIRSAPEPADAFLIAVPLLPFILKITRGHAICGFRSRIDHPSLQPGYLVVLESTSPPRTTVDLVAPSLENIGA